MFVITPAGRFGGYTMLGTAVTFSPIVLLFGSMFLMKNPTAKGTGILYWAVVAAMGASLGVNVLVYTGASIFQTFLITAAAFGALSLVGYTTKKDLTGMGSFLIMGVWGLIIASLVNMFLHSGGLSFIVNVLGVLIFSGLIAYDTQRLKMMYYRLGGDANSMGVATNYGALQLYINFINLFQFLLSLFGSRR
jgi:FtsH-binding integral membrane protein